MYYRYKIIIIEKWKNIANNKLITVAYPYNLDEQVTQELKKIS